MEFTKKLETYMNFILFSVNNLGLVVYVSRGNKYAKELLYKVYLKFKYFTSCTTRRWLKMAALKQIDSLAIFEVSNHYAITCTQISYNLFRYQYLSGIYSVLNPVYVLYVKQVYFLSSLLANYFFLRQNRTFLNVVSLFDKFHLS